MPLKVKNSTEFGRMLAAPAADIVTPAVHLQLLQNLNRSRPKYIRALNQSPAFWNLTFNAHSHTTMFALSRAYDSHDDSVNLKTMIKAASANPEWCSEAEFRTRKHGNPYVDSLAQSNRIPERRRIQYHLAFCSSPVVSRLQHWRHQAVAHRRRAHALTPQDVIARFPISMRNLQTLTKRAARMVNDYSDLFDATTYSTRVFGHDDYRGVLQAVHEHIQRHEAAITAELRRARLEQNGTASATQEIADDALGLLAVKARSAVVFKWRLRVRPFRRVTRVYAKTGC